EIGSETVRERKQLAYEGTVTLIVTINGETGELVGEPRMVARGVRGLTSTNGFVQPVLRVAETPAEDDLTSDAKRVVAAAVAGASRQTLEDETLLKEHLRVELKRFIQKQTGARPVIIPVVIRV
ncbi:MAG TPA: hypothetical protein VFU37_10820, partial [Pyrinomonadaceae bacterium]|nr:hypothetical protein [Pyrinomonadaceae bacterium]